MNMIYTESHFNFVKIHLLSHFSDHIRQFGNILMYSTEFGELGHMELIQDGNGRIRMLSRDKFLTATVVSMQSK